MELIDNRQVNLWRGSKEPPTKYHIWIKGTKLLLNNGSTWEVFVDNFSTVSELKKDLENLANSTINGKKIKDNPVLTSLDILIGKDLENFKATDSIIDILEDLDHSYTEGYPIKVTEDLNGVITVSLGNSDFKIQTTGESLSIRTQDNTIIFDSNALTSVPTESPLEWTKDKKLIHKDSGVIQGSYGADSDQNHAETIKVPNIKVDKKGHITNIQDKSITVRDYVDQLRPDDSSASDKPVLLAYSEGGKEQANPVRQASGLTYNDKSGDLKIKGTAVIGGGVQVNGGNLVIQEGFKIYGEIHGNVQGTATPKVHSSVNPEYGAASTSLYGHVIIQDDLGVTPPPPSNANAVADRTDIPAGTQAVAASPLMVWNALEKSKQFTRDYFSDDFEEKENKIYLRWEEIKG